MERSWWFSHWCCELTKMFISIKVGSGVNINKLSGLEFDVLGVFLVLVALFFCFFLPFSVTVNFTSCFCLVAFHLTFLVSISLMICIWFSSVLVSLSYLFFPLILPTVFSSHCFLLFASASGPPCGLPWLQFLLLGYSLWITYLLGIINTFCQIPATSCSPAFGFSSPLHKVFKNYLWWKREDAEGCPLAPRRKTVADEVWRWNQEQKNTSDSMFRTEERVDLGTIFQGRFAVC